MNNIITKQFFNYSELPDTFHYAICSSGYESRCTFIFEQIKLNNVKFEKKFCFSFEDNKTEITKKSDDFFKLHDFQFIKINDGSYYQIHHFLTETFNHATDNKEILNILVDYSSMTRVLYGEIIRYFANNIHLTKATCLYLLYAEGEFRAPSNQDIYNLHVEPVYGYSSLTIPEKPTALVIGLGYEKNRVFSLKEYLDAAEVYLFIADNRSDARYEKSVFDQNEKLLKEVPSRNLFKYPLNDLTYTEFILMSLIERLLSDYRIILAPCGPKPFTLLSFILSLRISDIDVWRISPGNFAMPNDTKATGNIIMFGITISK